MFDVLSKMLFFLMRPSNALILLLLLGATAQLTRFRRWGMVLIVAAVAGLCAGGFSPLANWLLSPLENRFSPPRDMPREVAGIIVLGGAIDTLVSGNRPFPGVEGAGERIMAVPQLARFYPSARIIYSGGTSHSRGENASEGEIAKELLGESGVALSRIDLEQASRNTWGNAVESFELAEPVSGENWLLVTSASHMPRAVGAFRAAGWERIIAYPVDFETAGVGDATRIFMSASMGLERLDRAVREWCALLAYWMTGRSDALFPSPRDKQ